MFLTYINDLVILLNRFGVKVKLFANDAKLYVKVVNTLAIDELQKALTALSQWADEWQLSFLLANVVRFVLVKLMLLTSFKSRMYHFPLLLPVATYR